MSHKELERVLGTADAHTASSPRTPRVTSVAGAVATVPLADLPPRGRAGSLGSHKGSWNVSVPLPPWPARGADGTAAEKSADSLL